MGNSKFDKILTQLGTGKWNFLYFFAASYWFLWMPGEYYGGIYLAPNQDYTCLPPENASVDAISLDSCHYFVNETTKYGEGTQVEYPCTSWEYDTSIYTSTLTSEFDLVCERAYLRATFQSSLVLATMFTSVITGYLSDRFGRKKVLLASQVLYTVTSLSMLLVRDFSAVVAFRFISGAYAVIFLYALAMEVCEIKYRSLVGVLIGLPWAVGISVWGSLAYLIRSWRYLKLTVTLPHLLLFPCLYFMDESPRWLIVKGEHDRALKVLRKAARWNNVELPNDSELENIFLDIQRQHTTIDEKSEIIDKKVTCTKNTLPKVIRTPKIRMITLLLCLIMFMIPLASLGVSLSGDIYSNDPFLYVILMGITQIPSFTVTAPLIKWFGRKKFIIGSCITSGVGIIAIEFVPEDMTWLMITLAMVGSLCLCAAWMTMDIYINELLPTEVRLQGLGTSLLFSQIAATLAPFITLVLGPLVPWFPSVIFGASCFIAAAATLPLTETQGVPMLETVEELEVDSRRQNNDTRALETPILS